jgi:drug/metabolite transporter (DMT)-like permease
MLRRPLSRRKWLSLLLLVVGVSIVQLPHNADSSRLSFKQSPEPKSLLWRRTSQLIGRSDTYEGISWDEALQHPPMNTSVGLATVLVACVLSGLAGVSFEKILKESTTHTSLWIRNVQLSFWSMFPAFFLGVLFMDGEKIAKTGFLAGYNWIVWAAIISQAVGGVIVALVINYADNISKNFATSISILFSYLASVYFFDFKIRISVCPTSFQLTPATNFDSSLSACPLFFSQHLCTANQTTDKPCLSGLRNMKRLRSTVTRHILMNMCLVLWLKVRSDPKL